MRLRIFVTGLIAALALGLGALGCPLTHDSYPSSGGTCRTSNDCFAGEACSDGGACEPAPGDGDGDAGRSDARSDGGPRG
jgi:hypothetical protein